MITKLHLKDFESHKDTSLNFPNGLTVFIGETDKGKSGIFRAFNWVRTNRPRGDSMLPLYWDSKYSEVSVTLEDGNVITRTKGKSVNEYRIPALNWKSNAGTDIPVEVVNTLNMEEDIHFQSQIDRPFLMYETPGERGRILNKIAGLDKIDSCLRNASQDIRKLKAKKENAVASINTIKEELKQFISLPTISTKLNTAEELGKLICNKQHLITTVLRLLPRKTECEKITEKKHILENISEKVIECRVLIDSIGNKENVLTATQTLKTSRKELLLKRKKKDILVKIEAELKVLQKLGEELDRQSKRYNKVSELISQYDRKDKLLSNVENEIINIKKSIPNSCPTCGSTLK